MMDHIEIDHFPNNENIKIHCFLYFEGIGFVFILLIHCLQINPKRCSGLGLFHCSIQRNTFRNLDNFPRTIQSVLIPNILRAKKGLPVI